MDFPHQADLNKRVRKVYLMRKIYFGSSSEEERSLATRAE